MESGNKRHACGSCQKSFHKKCDLAKHVDSMHMHREYIRCHLCSTPTKNKASLRYHLAKMHKCHRCQLHFKTMTERKEHLKIHPTNDNAHFRCQLCNRGHSSSKDLKRHMLIHTDKKPLGCPLCPRRFRVASGLSRHLKTHTGEKPFQCEHCPKLFADAGDRRKHLRVHTLETPFECIFCGKKFKFSSALHSHYRTHVQERPFNCKICAKELAQATHLTTHLRTHTGEKPYQCGKCFKRFSLNFLRVEHENAGCRRPRNVYRCVFCDRGLARKDNYFSHLRNHVNERPFSCNFCDSWFLRNDLLKDHIIQIHTGEQPYMCKNCNFSSSTQHFLYRHQRFCSKSEK